MSQDLVSSVPGIFTALLGLVQTAAAAMTPQPAVFAFELGQYEPGRYVTVHEIKGPDYQWEDIGTFAQKEIYEICGLATVFTGDSVTNNANVATQVLADTIDLFQTCVMTPVMSNRTMPLLGTTGPSPLLMLPDRMAYDSGPGEIAGGEGGWVGKYEWSFHFEAIITPA